MSCCPIGRLNKKVELQSYTEAKDSVGGTIRTWSTYATVWAAIKPFRGRERLLAQQVQAIDQSRIIIRYDSRVSADDRVLFGTRIYEITAVIDADESNVWLELMCKELK
jgi:SPP1 family predicted phage head-tail adaptor